MSSLWTPGGERPVSPQSDTTSSTTPPSNPTTGSGPADGFDPDGMPSEEQLAQLREELARTPASVVVANHCFGLFELAALHLSIQPPQLDQASIAIDALDAMVEKLGSRLEDTEAQLREGVAQLKMAFVKIRDMAEAAGEG